VLRSPQEEIKIEMERTKGKKVWENFREEWKRDLKETFKEIKEELKKEMRWQG